MEWRTSTNLFNWYSHVAPFLHYVDEGIAQERGSGFRARASAQHPIALTAALVMLLPLALYLYQRHRRRIWLGSAAFWHSERFRPGRARAWSCSWPCW